MRAIDGDELKNQIRHMPRTVNPDLVQYALVQAIIADMPTLTPPEIVCCQDCVHHEDGYAHWCNKWEHTCPDDSEFFCKFGRKKNDSTTD